MLQLLKKLTVSLPAISGDEGGIAAIIKDLASSCCDEVRTDALGNLICRKKGREGALRVLLTAHMDEIGFLVSYIEENGYLRISPIGGVDLTAAAYSKVKFKNGLTGVLVPIADVSPKEALKATHMVVDIGVDSRRAAEKKVSVGEPLALASFVERLSGKRVFGRPLDNRIGCAVLLDALQKLGNAPVDLYVVFTVQEEVGCRGAGAAAFGIVPDIAINVDVTATGDEMGAKPMAVKLGGGVAVKFKDSSVISDRFLTSRLLSVAKEEKIAVQSEILTAGGTDTSAVQMTGVGCRASALSIPCRYIHSGVEVLDLADAEAAVSLLLSFLQKQTKNDIFPQKGSIK